ncbi:MAG TPA: fused MFS/spermidine synthase [Isosphaeraceae bacterium]|nr:fused MFS/spermidine synthase [Isosphaeraceae bacterium]
MPALFSAVLFLAAALLFCVEPMVAKMVLHLLGGTPSVWNTCMVFFQVALLGGYAYAHATTAWLGVRRQAVLHVGLLVLPLLVLPIGVTRAAVESLPHEGNPIFWLIGLLVGTVGLPFFVLATTAPLLQKWFASTRHRAASDPYFLYGASNLGGLLALLSYPLLIGPALQISQQSRLWAMGYGLFSVLMVACAIVVWRTAGSSQTVAPDPEAANGESFVEAPPEPAVTVWRRARWVALAFVPSSLMLGVTTYITTDLASIPLLWVIPLALYLLSFIVAFARRPLVPHSWVVKATPVLVAMLAYRFFLEPEGLIWIPLHLLGFFVLALFCHGELARDRPHTRHLTEFYLWIAVGGALGGMFNALLAPLMFDRVAEYPLVIVLACLFRHTSPEDRPTGLRGPIGDITAAALVGVLAGGMVLCFQHFGVVFNGLPMKLAIGFLVIVCYLCEDRPLRFALAVGASILASGFYTGVHGRVLLRERNFFGTVRVTLNPSGEFHQLVHGGTLHGRQSLAPAHRLEPLSYYGHNGPIGQVFDVYHHPSAKPTDKASVAVVGLGAGALASYAEPTDRLVFYEIDPAVTRLARDPRYFSYLRDCRARSLEIVHGDARLRLREAPDHAYGLIVLDAFSSDSVPIHLLTREAVELYLSKLADGGLLAFHISSNYLDFKPLLAALATDARLVALGQDDFAVSEEDLRKGCLISEWVVLARDKADLGSLAGDSRWQVLVPRPGFHAWTDDFSDILALFRGMGH